MPVSFEYNYESCMHIGKLWQDESAGRILLPVHRSLTRLPCTLQLWFGVGVPQIPQILSLVFLKSVLVKAQILFDARISQISLW